MMDSNALVIRFNMLEEEIASLKGIIHVMLEELEKDSISDTARRVRGTLEHFDGE